MVTQTLSTSLLSHYKCYSFEREDRLNCECTTKVWSVCRWYAAMVMSFLGIDLINCVGARTCWCSSTSYNTDLFTTLCTHFYSTVGKYNSHKSFYFPGKRCSLKSDLCTVFDQHATPYVVGVVLIRSIVVVMRTLHSHCRYVNVDLYCQCLNRYSFIELCAWWKQKLRCYNS